jgi:hypothetical protein
MVFRLLSQPMLLTTMKSRSFKPTCDFDRIEANPGKPIGDKAYDSERLDDNLKNNSIDLMSASYNSGHLYILFSTRRSVHRIGFCGVVPDPPPCLLALRKMT